MSEKLKSYLLRLHAILDQSYGGRAVEACNIVQDILSLCLEATAETDLGYLSSLIFSDDVGLIKFVVDTLKTREFENTRTDILQLLSGLVLKLGDSIADYCQVLKGMCLKILSQDPSSKAKVENYNLLAQLLSIKSAVVAENFDVGSLALRLVTAFEQSTRDPATVRGALYSLIGVLSEKYPEHITIKTDRILSIFMSVLKKEMTSTQKKPEFQVIAGCFKGLKGLLVHFTQSVEEGSKAGADLYNYIKMVLNTEVQYSRYDLPKAALGILAKHACQFRELLATDYKIYYDCLLKWGRSGNKDLKYAGMAALDSVLDQVASFVKEKADTPKRDLCMKVLKDLLLEFHRILNADMSSAKDLSIAVKGYGYFAGACKELLTEGGVKKMFEQILQRGQHIYSSIETQYEDKMEYLPGFLEALANIIRNIDQVPDVYLLPMEKMVLLMFENYPKFGKGGKFLFRKGIVQFLLALSKNASLLKACLSHLVYQMVIRTCSHPLVGEEDILPSVQDDKFPEVRVSYRSYLELWYHLLNDWNYKASPLQQLTEQQSISPHCLRKHLYNEIILSILAVLNKLNLRTEKEIFEDAGSAFATDAKDVSSDPVSGLTADVPKDFQIFINIVDFSRDIILRDPIELFHDWIVVFIRDVMELSSRYPLVSGFYKLLEIGCIVCRKINFFKGIKSITDEYSEQRIAFVLFRKHKMDVLGRVKQFKDDLLASCLHFVLSLPIEIVEDDFERLTTSVQTALKIGLSHLPLANATLDALEQWTETLDASKLVPFLRGILPCLDDYLQSSTEGEGELDDAKALQSLTKSFKTRRGRTPTRLIKALRKAEMNLESPLGVLRARIIRFLGCLGGLNALLIKEGRIANVGRAVAWDCEKHLSFALPFPDMKPTIYLDHFLPRVIELAVSSSDRQTKVISCELLHALVLFMLGKSVQQPGPMANKMSMEKLYRNVFPALVKLACDVEQVAEQLFRPLVMQLIHWFTCFSKCGSPETMVLLDSIFEGVVSHTDSALRDFCAVCLREFLQWSIKQTSEKQMAKAPLNPKNIFKRISSYAVHPNAFKRLGAAVAFNNIYRVFREEKSLVDIFALELLVVFVNSLACAHSDEANIGTIDHCKEALKHLERIIKQRTELLIKPNNKRRVPMMFQELDNFCLPHVIPWLLKECGRLQTECRHQSMELVFSLSPCQPGVGSAKEWMSRTLQSNGPNFFISKFEGGGKAGSGLVKYPKLSSISKKFSLAKTVHWLECLLAALDCYTWVAGSSLVDPLVLLTTEESNLFVAMEYFITHIALNDLDKVSATFDISYRKVVVREPFSPAEEERFNRLKCTAVVRMFDCLVAMLTRGCLKAAKADSKIQGIFNKDLFTAISRVLMHPESVGFNIGDIVVLAKLPQQMLQLTESLAKYLPDECQKEFIKVLSTFVYQERYDLIGQLPVDFADNQSAAERCGKLMQLVNGYQLLNDAKLLRRMLKSYEIQKLSTNIIASIVNGLLSFSGGDDSGIKPIQKRLADRMLSFFLQISTQESKIAPLLYDKSPVKSDEGSNIVSPKGVILYHLFHPIVNEHLLQQKREFVNVIDMGMKDPYLLSNILQTFLMFVQRRSQSSKCDTLASSLLQTILGKWSSFADWWMPHSPAELKEGLVNIFKSMITIDGKYVIEDETGKKALAACLSLLHDQSIGITFKSHILELLPIVLKYSSENQNQQIKENLDKLIVFSFPLSSDELVPSSRKHSEYMDCLDKLLHTLLMSEATIILEILLPVIVRETDEIYESKMSPFISAVTKKLKPDRVREFLRLSYDVSMNDEQYTTTIRKGAMERICLPILHHTTIANKRAFFVEVVKEIMDKIEIKVIKNPETAFENCLITKLGCFKILQCMYAVLTRDEVMTPSSEIVKAYTKNPQTGKELTQAVTKLAHATKSEDSRGETVLIPLRKELYCAAYSTLASVIACTQSDVKFYTGFLFAENLAKGQLLLDNLVDTSKSYEFEVELTVPFARKQQLQAIRRQDINKENDDQKESSYRRHGVHAYLSSQYLMGSSLSQDVNQYDFNTPIQAYSSYNESQTSSTLGDRTRSIGGVTEDEPEVVLERTLELDYLNQSSIMQTFISLLRTMKDSKVYKEPSSEKEAQEMPSWMLCLHRKFSQPDTNLNVKLFIAKLVANEFKIFQPFGQHWFGPLIQSIIRSQIPGNPMSYFVVDVVVAMLSWSTNCIPEDSVEGRNMASSLLEYLIKYCHHTNRSILKNNLQIIKTLTQVWKDRLEIPYKLIYDKFSGTDPAKRDNATGIQILGVILTNGYPPYRHHLGLSEERYFKALVINLTFKYKDVYASTAEVVGLALKYCKENDMPDNELSSIVYDQLFELSTSNKEKFITSLHGIHLSHPDFVDRFINQLLFCLPSLFGTFKTQCLECIASRIDDLPNRTEVFSELKTKGLQTMLSHRDESTLAALIKVISGVTRNLSSEETLPLLDLVSAVKEHPSVELREEMYELFMWIYDSFRTNGNMDTDSNEFEVLKISKEILLLGINDDNTSLSLKILNFWRHETRLPSTSIERLIEILRALYSQKTEKEFLKYSTNLMLQLTSLSPDYSMPLFDQPLDAEKGFQEYPINFSWQRQRVAMTPLFAVTQVFTQSQTQGDGRGTMQYGMLRATQEKLSFTVTQDVQKTLASTDWMTPSAQVESPPFSPTRPSLDTQSALLIKQQKGRARGDFGKGTLKARLGSPKATDETDAGEGSKSEVLRLKRRFMKDPNISRKFFANQEIRRQERRQQEIERQKAAHDQRVVMYRKYRSGELPDIQIKHSELIVPLQALAQHDSTIAQRLFVTIVDAVVSQLPEKLTPQVLGTAQSDIRSSLDTMISSTTLFYPPFVHAVEDSCYRQKELVLNPLAVSTASNMGNEQPIGILLLEKQLLKKSATYEPKAKRRKGAEPPSDITMTWTQLARLYKSIQEYDFVHSIFGSQPSSSEITKKALGAEVRNDFAAAVKHYNKALSLQDWDGDSPTLEEEEFWDYSRIKCYENLCQWPNLLQLTLQSIDEDSPANVNKIWDDITLQEQYLPSYILSNLKLWCQGQVQDMHKDFHTFIQDALGGEESRHYLETRFAEELAMINILQSNYSTARHYLGVGIQGFLEDWCSFSKLLSKNRFARLQKLQKLQEMGEFIDLTSKGGSLNSATVEKMLDKWGKRLPNRKLDPLLVWDDIILNRRVFLQKLKDCSQSWPRAEYEALSKRLDMEEARSIVLVADVARQQGNYRAAFQYLNDAISSKVKILQTDLSVDWCHVYAKVHNETSRNLETTDAVVILVSALDHLNQQRPKVIAKDRLLVRYNLLEYETWQRLIDVLLKADLPTRKVDSLVGDKQQEILQRCYSFSLKGDVDRCIQMIRDFSLKAMQGAEASANNLDPSVAQDRELQVTCLMTLANYCDTKLKNKENGDMMDFDDECADSLIRHMLKAMSLNSKEARQLFPRLLQVVEFYPDTRDTFKKKSENVPEWMFLDWINQLAAHLDKEHGLALESILKRIAKSYPQALIYPLNISSEQYSFPPTEVGKVSEALVQSLRQQVANPVCLWFIEALEQLTNPEFVFKDWREDVRPLLSEKERKANAIKNAHDSIYSKLFVHKDRSKGSNGLDAGNVRKRFAKINGAKYDALFGKDGQNLFKMSEKEFRGKHESFFQEMKTKSSNWIVKGNSSSLKEFSPWLSSFRSDKFVYPIEIPGQYAGKKKPLTEYHVKIVGFDDRILSMSSLRAPKRITIHGDDENEYKFLVKGGEDLRLDQRIEQLFDIMNGILAEDVSAITRGLQLKTYQVIPMTNRLGIIEWLDNTIPLKDLLLNTFTEEEKKAYSGSKGPSLRHMNFMKTYKKTLNMYKQVNRNTAEKEFRSLKHSIQWDLLRRALESLSSSTEAYFILRNNFIRTHSCVCICHYILGIGDRHLSNFLIDTTSGGVIGIDFGYSFGAATQLLAKPEMMPFRLTPQMTNLLLPLTNNGPYKETMAYVLQALRKNPDVLLNTMDVFVKEPLLDWEVYARRQTPSLGKSESKRESDWYPKEKIQFCKMKLNGINPAYITGEEVKTNLNATEAGPFQFVAYGHSELNVRKKLMDEAQKEGSVSTYSLSVEDQVDCLVDQATDPDILFRAFYGWEAWI